MNSLFGKVIYSPATYRTFAGNLLTNGLVNPVSRQLVALDRKKHWNPKFKKERAKKVIKITLPDYDEMRKSDNLTPEEMRSKLKEKGIVPHREWNEKPMFISCSGDVFDPYVPPEGDGKLTLVTTPGIKQKYEVIGKKGKSYLALRKIRNIDYDFDVPTVANQAEGIYIEAQKALANNDDDRLHDLVTEKCFPEMTDNVKNKTIRWKFIQSLEPSRIVQVRCQDLMSKEHVFGQVTVRLHTQQTLAVYDRFGRLMHGSEDVVKDVLEYIVFEKHLTNAYGAWKIHAKIIPDWLPPRDTILKTYQQPGEEPEPQFTETKTEEPKKDESSEVAVA